MFAVASYAKEGPNVIGHNNVILKNDRDQITDATIIPRFCNQFTFHCWFWHTKLHLF